MITINLVLIIIKVHSSPSRWGAARLPFASRAILPGALRPSQRLALGQRFCAGVPEHIPGLGMHRFTWKTSSSKQGKLTTSSVYANTAAHISWTSGKTVRAGAGISWKTGRAGLLKRLYLHAWGQEAAWGKCERKHYHVYCLLSWSQQDLEDDKETSSVLRTSLKVCQAGHEPYRPHQITTNFHYVLYKWAG